MAQGDVRPTWPLPTVKPKFSVTSVGGGRPFGCASGKCERWHAGIDYTSAPDGALIVAPEDATVVAINVSWSEGSKAVFLRTKTGLFVVLGGFKNDSHKEFKVNKGDQVAKGASLGRILGSYGMIHLETYRADDRTKNSPWWADDSPPDGLLNPTAYTERMVSDSISLVLTRQRHEALAKLGYFKGAEGDPWGPKSEDALRAAQTALGLTADGKWGPKTEAAIKLALLGSAETDTGSESTEALQVETLDLAPPWLKVASGVMVVGATLGVLVVLWRRR